MDNQPMPLAQGAVSCANCKFSRLVRASPTDLTRILTCRLFPPQNVFAITPAGAQPLGSAFPIVNHAAWCFQFQRIAEGDQREGEEAPAILGSDGQKLLS